MQLAVQKGAIDAGDNPYMVRAPIYYLTRNQSDRESIQSTRRQIAFDLQRRSFGAVKSQATDQLTRHPQVWAIDVAMSVDGVLSVTKWLHGCRAGDPM